MRTSRPRVFSVGVVAILASLALSTATITAPLSAQPGGQGTATAPTGPAQRFAGNYRHTPAATENANFERAIDQAVNGMMFGSDFARERLREKLAPIPTLGISAQGAQVVFAARLTITGTLGANTQAQTSHGHTMNVRVDMVGGHLVQTLGTDNGTVRNEFVLSTDNRTLTVHVTVTSDRLGAPVVYSRTYTRQ